MVMHMRKGWQRRKSLKKQQLLEERSREKLNQKLDEAPVFLEVKKNADFIKNILGDSTDLIMRWFTIQYTPDRRAVVMCIDGLVDKKTIDQSVLRPLMIKGEEIRTKEDLWKIAYESLVQSEEVKKVSQLKEMVGSLLSGDAILFVDGYSEGLVIGVNGWPQRGWKSPGRNPWSGDPGKA